MAGKRWEDKVSDIRQDLTKAGADIIVIPTLDEIAWLLNLRGHDLPYTPIFRSYLIMDHEQVILFVDPRKVQIFVSRLFALLSPT
jgi:Xaa-Pro aminopeptidase